MFQGYFSYSGTNEQKKRQYTFLNGYATFSEYVSCPSFLPINFLVKKNNKQYYIELLNKSRLNEIYHFHSNLDLFNSKGFRERLKSQSEIFVIFDETTNEISLIRDQFGTVPLFYSHTGTEFAFASDINVLLPLPSITDINSVKIANYLTWQSDGNPYDDSTFFKNIHSVLPGHLLHATPKTISSSPIISVEPNKWSHLNNLEDYGIAFREIFAKSVNSYVEEKPVIASHLSGGMDSSSVSSMIRHVSPQSTLHTLYADTQTASTNESHYARMVANDLKSIHSVVYPSTNELDLMISNISLYGFPEHMSITPSLQTDLIKTASNLGSNILMTGTDGDSIVGHGFEYIEELYQRNSWQELNDSLTQWATSRSGIGTRENWDSFTPEDKIRLVFKDFFYQKLARSSSVSEILRLLKVAKHKFGTRYSDLFLKSLYAFRNRIKYLDQFPDSILSKDLKDIKTIPQIDTLDKILMGDLPDKYTFAFKDVFYSQAIAINEEKFYIGRANKVQIGYPFYNRELFELCVSTPPRIKYDNGIGRGHFREAMKGILIEEVRNRRDKGIFSSYARNAGLRLYSQSKDFLTDNNIVWNYVNKSLFLKSIKLLQAEKQPAYVHNRSLFFVNRTIYLSIWLDNILHK